MQIYMTVLCDASLQANTFQFDTPGGGQLKGRAASMRSSPCCNPHAGLAYCPGRVNIKEMLACWESVARKLLRTHVAINIPEATKF